MKETKKRRRENREIALYGKGGIGKSTLAANVSAALAAEGERVLQIGCDPKHDSTRLLLGGRIITTVLDYIRVTPPTEQRLDEVLFEGAFGVGCVEAGGPKPGVGCAGRGIITAFELLAAYDVKSRYSRILYDVLGDVVCGGFAVPIRREYADTVLLVTSGEFMSLYAANNILRGVANFDGEMSRIGGILYNRRNVEGEDERVRAFAEAVELPILAVFPRSEVFTAAEREKRTVIQGEDNEIRRTLIDLAKMLQSGIETYPARGLGDEELESVVLGGGILPAESAASVSPSVPAEVKGKEEPRQAEDPISLSNPNRYLSKSIVHDEPLHGCAFNGAINIAIHLRDAAVLAHAPKSCTYISYQTFSSPGRRNLFERGMLMPAPLLANFSGTDMDEPDMVFGGTDHLLAKAAALKAEKPKALIVVSACPAGIIGDDTERVASLAEPDLPVVVIRADGNLNGDYLQGMIQAYTSIAKALIRTDASPKPRSVNVVFEKTVAKNTEANFAVIRHLLAALDIEVNCRYLYEAACEDVENFLAAPLNLLAYRDYLGDMLEDFFVRNYGCRFMAGAFPVGFEETKIWLLQLAEFFDREAAAQRLIAAAETAYRREVERLKPLLRGKRLMIITYNHELDWILKTALDLEMDIVKLAILNYSQDIGFRTALDRDFPIEENYDRGKRLADIAALRPDILLSNYESAAGRAATICDTIPICPDVGFDSGLHLAKRWGKMLALGLSEGEWKHDEALLNKHYR